MRLWPWFLLIACLLLPVRALPAPAPSAHWQQGALQLDFFAAPQKVRIFPGESLVINVSTRVQGLPSGSLDFHSAFSGTLFQGNDLLSTGSQMRGGGLSFPSQISAETSVTVPAIVNNWCSTLLPAGRYTLRLYVRPMLCLAAPPSQPPSSALFIEPSVELTCPFEIIPPDEPALRTLFADLAAQPPTSPAPGLSYSLVVGALGLADSPLALPHQAQLLSRPALAPALVEDMLRKFSRRREDLPTATMLLGVLAKLPAEGPAASTHQKILAALCRMRGTNPQFLQLTAPAYDHALALGAQHLDLEHSGIFD